VKPERIVSRPRGLPAHLSFCEGVLHDGILA
jgi:hypothetical protein